MTLKERIENNLTLYTLSLLLTGFLSGVAGYKFFLDNINSGRSKTVLAEQCRDDLWKEPARQATWIPKAECPAYPVEIKVSSPGSNAIIGIRENHERSFETPVVITSSRSLPNSVSIGLVIKPKDIPNYYILFPYFNQVIGKNAYRVEYIYNLPFSLKSGMSLELHALMIDDERKIGELFSSVEQIKAVDPSVFISEPVQVQVK